MLEAGGIGIVRQCVKREGDREGVKGGRERERARTRERQRARVKGNRQRVSKRKRERERGGGGEINCTACPRSSAESPGSQKRTQRQH